MSKMCGDTARYNRIRKQRIAKRSLARELQAEIVARRALVPPAAEKPIPAPR